MKYTKPLAMASTVLCLSSFTPVYAQDNENSADLLDTIVVTGRNREEDLQDVPVSTSVISDTLLEDAGIENLYDLFEMVPGLHYDEGTDRLAALPSIRGIQASDIAPNRTKVSSFIDGMPVLGSAGTIGFNGFQQVEVYRGPQSAAFGRSTFAGAINYVTRNPGDDFEGSVGFNVSDYGTKTAEFSVGGPITDTLGFLLNYTKEDSSSPDEYHATGSGGLVNVGGTDFNVGQSDGTEFGARTGDNVSGKLVFQPDDTLKFSMTFNHVETHDQQAPVMFLTQEGRDECFEGNGVFVNAGMMAPWLIGEMDCDWDAVRPLYSQHSVEDWLINNPLNTEANVIAAIGGTDALVVEGMGPGAMVYGTPEPAGDFTLADGTVLSIEEQILLIAKAYSVPEDSRGTLSERDRFTFQADKLFDNGSALQFSFMQSDETFQRANATGFYYMDPDNFSALNGGATLDGIPNTYDGFSDGADLEWEGYATTRGDQMTGWRIQSGMGAPRLPTPSFGEISEQYAELRWVSPAEDRLRYVVGASFYDYDYLEERWGGPGGGAEFLPATALFHPDSATLIDQYMQLAQSNPDPNFVPIPFAPDNEIIGEQATNTAVYFNVAYDLTDRATLSFEGRQANDVIGATNETTGLSEEVTTTSFVPRVALTYDLSDRTSFYAQWAKGVNPAGINVGVLSANTLDVLNNGVAGGLVPFDAAVAVIDDFNNNDATDLTPDGIPDLWDSDAEVWYELDGFTPITGSTYDSGFVADDFTSYKEEEITQIEFGIKGSALDGRLTYSGAVYSINWADQIQNGSIDLDSPCANNASANDVTSGPCTVNGMDYFYIATTDGGTIDTNLNFGDVIINGAEIEANYRITDNWDIRAQASIMKGEYDEFCDIGLFNAIDFTELDGVTAGTGAAVPDFPDYMTALGLNVRRPTAGESLTSDCYVTDGNTLANQPEISWSLSPSFNTDIGNMRFTARLDVRHEGKQYDNSANFNWYPAATTANLNFGLSGDSWSATLYVNNLLDEDSPRNVSGFPDDTAQQGDIDYGRQDPTGVGLTPMTGYLGETWVYQDLDRDSFQFQPRAPRSIGLRASYRF